MDYLGGVFYESDFNSFGQLDPYLGHYGLGLMQKSLAKFG